MYDHMFLYTKGTKYKLNVNKYVDFFGRTGTSTCIRMQIYLMQEKKHLP